MTIRDKKGSDSSNRADLHHLSNKKYSIVNLNIVETNFYTYQKRMNPIDK